MELTTILWPLMHQQFMTYFLVPFVAVLLISEDHGYTMDAKVHKIMVASSDAGILVHPADNNNTALDEIMQKIILAFWLGKPEILTHRVDGTEEAVQTLLQLQGQTAKASLIPQLCISTDMSHHHLSQNLTQKFDSSCQVVPQMKLWTSHNQTCQWRSNTH